MIGAGLAFVINRERLKKIYLRLEALGGSLSGQAQARSSQVRTNPDRLGRRDVFDSV